MTAATQPIAYLGRRYGFSASHRLHTDRLDDGANRSVFGKCNNPHGHGHNYRVEVLLRGPVDPVTGMVVDLAELDRFAETEILRRFDGQNLNTLPCFEHMVSTTENLTWEIARIFRRFRGLSSGAELVNVHVEETSNNSFDLPAAAWASEGTEAGKTWQTAT